MAERAGKAAVFVGLPVLAAVMVVLYAPWQLVESDPSVLWLVAAGAVLQAFPVPIGPQVKASLATIAMYFALLLFGPSAAIAVSIGFGLAVVPFIPKGAKLLKGPFNVAMFVVSAALAAEAFVLVAGAETGPTDAAVGSWIPAIVLAVVVYFTVNNVLISLAIWAAGGPPPLRTLPGVFGAAWFGDTF